MYGPLRKTIDAGLLACLSIGALYIGARVALVPHDPARGAAVIFPPWTAADRALSRATDGGARFVRFGGAAFIAVVEADDAAYPEHMLDAGAWLVVDPQVLAACSTIFANAAPNS